LILQVRPNSETFATLNGGLIPVISRKDDGTVEIEIPNYHENNGNIHWNLMWPRTKYQN
jgi:hypothetical protein